MTCPICGGTLHKCLEGLPDFQTGINDIPFSIEKCGGCGTGYTMPPLSTEELNRYYPSSYSPYQKKKNAFSYISYKIKESEITRLRNRVPHPGASLFEIGTGNGDMLHLAQQQGFVVSGSDLGNQGIATIKERFDIDIIPANAEDLVFELKYDIVVLRHVLEHINHFSDVVRNIHDNALEEGGVFYVSVPNFDAIEVRLFKRYTYGLDVPRHRTHFTREGLTMLLHWAGFSRVEVFYRENIYDYARGYLRMVRSSRGLKKLIKAVMAPYYVIMALPALFHKSTLEIIATK